MTGTSDEKRLRVELLKTQKELELTKRQLETVLRLLGKVLEKQNLEKQKPETQEG